MSVLLKITITIPVVALIVLVAKKLLAGTVPLKWCYSIALITIVLMGIGCSADALPAMENEIVGYSAETLFKYKTKYVGDAPKVGAIAGHLPFSQYKRGISLQTETEPYGLTVNYVLTPDEFSTIMSTGNKEILQNAAIIFCLVDNVGTIQLRFDDGSSIHTYAFDREGLGKAFGHDFREYSSSIEVFKDEFLPLLSGFGPEDAGDYNTPVSIDKIAFKVEANLEVITSSPKGVSNPWPYMETHPTECEEILKMGDAALDYMLSQFATGRAQGLKAHVMMSLCKDILGDRNNVAEGTYSSPMEWYLKLEPYTARKLLEFSPRTKDEIENLVYSAALNRHKSNKASMVVVAPRIFGTHKSGNTLMIFATVYYSGFNLYGNILSQEEAAVVPSAIIYSKNSDGTYTLVDYVNAKDGSYWRKSIEEFCAPRSDIARAILKHYGNYSDLEDLMKMNTMECLKQNNLTGIFLKSHTGELIPLT